MGRARGRTGDDGTATENTRETSSAGEILEGGNQGLQSHGIRRGQRKRQGRELGGTRGQESGKKRRRIAAASDRKPGYRKQCIKSSDATVVKHLECIENDFNEEKSDHDSRSVQDVSSTKTRKHKGKDRGSFMDEPDNSEKIGSQPFNIRRNERKGFRNIDTGQSESKNILESVQQKSVKITLEEETVCQENTSAIRNTTLRKRRKQNDFAESNSDKISDISVSSNEKTGKKSQAAVRSRKRVIEPPDDDLTWLPDSDKTRNTVGSGKQKSVKENISCPVCKKTFPSKTKTMDHMRHQHRNSHVCIKCMLVFENVPDLRKHMLIHKPLLCEKCGNAYENAVSLNHHIQSVHDGIRLYKCDYEGCTQTFADKCNKKKHIDGVHLNMRKEQCKVCSKTFKNTSALKVHVYSYHTDDAEKMKLPCQVCEKVFTTHAALRQHLTMHTDLRPYMCSYKGCNKKFRLTSNRHKHEMMHADIRPYKCDVCDQSFSRKEYLRSHAYKHTGEKAFSCSVCSKSFTQKGNLTSHMAVHSDTRVRYSCNQCQKSFTFKSNLTKHKISHHGGVADSRKETSPTEHGQKQKIGNKRKHAETGDSDNESKIADNDEKEMHKADSSSPRTISVILKHPNSSGYLEMGYTVIIDNKHATDATAAVDNDIADSTAAVDDNAADVTSANDDNPEITDDTSNLESNDKIRPIDLSPSGNVLLTGQTTEPSNNATEPKGEQNRASGISELKVQLLPEDIIRSYNDEGVEIQDNHTKDSYSRMVKLEVTETLLDTGTTETLVDASTTNSNMTDIKGDPSQCVEETNSENVVPPNIQNDVSHDVTENSSFFGTDRFADYFKRNVKSEATDTELPELCVQHSHNVEMDLSSSTTPTENLNDFNSISAKVPDHANIKLETENDKCVYTDSDSTSTQNAQESNLQSMQDCDFITFPMMNSVSKVATCQMALKEQLLSNIEDEEQSNDVKGQLSGDLFQTFDAESDHIVSDVDCMQQFDTSDNIKTSISGTVDKTVDIETRNREMVVMDKYTESQLISNNTVIDTIADNNEQRSEAEISAESLIENL